MVSSRTILFWEKEFAAAAASATLDANDRDTLDRCINFLGDVRDRTILDIGCGLGKNSIALAQLGALVTSIDTSRDAVAKLSSYAKAHNLHITALVRDALEIDKLGVFDFVVGSMILHHIEPFSLFCEALFAALKPHGRAFFHENNAASRLLVWMRTHVVGRLWVPKYGDPDEFPLQPQEVDMLRHRFKVTRMFPEFVFFQLISPYLLKGRGSTWLKSLDDLICRHGVFVEYSYRQDLLIEKTGLADSHGDTKLAD